MPPERRIVGFHQDDEGQWVAELECGHTQHVRHDPPWQVRPWTQAAAGRAELMGSRLPCRPCEEIAVSAAAREDAAFRGLCAEGAEEAAREAVRRARAGSRTRGGIQPPLAYEIDAADRITEVAPEWTTVAREAAAPALEDALVVGRPLWDFITDPTTRQLYARILERVRGGGGPLTFGFRCDTPTERRLMEMRISRLEAGSVRFAVRVIASQARPAVALLDAATPRRGLVRMCSWCKRLPTASGEWLEVEEALRVLDILDAAPLPAITHGICPACYEAVMGALDREETGRAGGPVLGPLPPG